MRKAKWENGVVIWLSVSVVLILAALVPGWHRKLAIAVLAPIIAFLVKARGSVTHDRR
jgi:hypothetical protein